MRAATVTLLIALAACAGGSGSVGGGAPESAPMVVGGDLRVTAKDAPYVTTVALSVDAIFKALPAAFDTLGIPLTVLDFKSHTIGNQGLKITHKLGRVALSKYMDCGNAQNVPSADTYDVFITVVTVVRPHEPVGSDIVTTFTAAARPMMVSQDYFKCSTTGELEKRIAALAQPGR